MENKYYTPSIEEFHVGFEYEYDYGSGKYEKMKYTTTQESLVGLANGFINFCRVKYLDRFDIEEMGFIPEYGSADSSGNLDKSYIYYTKDNISIRLLRSNDTKIKISVFNGDERTIKNDEEWFDTFQEFRGTIKNKSELKRILKTLGVDV